MALEGFLQEFGLADILQLIYFQKKTGILNIDGRDDRIKLTLVNGNITGLESQRRSEEDKLGKILVKKGLITADNLKAALEIQKKKNIRLGLVFLRQRLVLREVLIETIQNQIIETLVQVFTWKEGRYEFIPQALSIDKELPISLDTQHLLMDSLRLIDEWSLIDGRLNLNAVYKKVKEPAPDQLNKEEKRVLNLVDGESDVSTIIFVSYLGDFETAKALISLEEKGIIEPVIVRPVEKEKAPVRAWPFALLVGGIILVITAFVLQGDYRVFKSFKRIWGISKIERLKDEIDVYAVVNGRYPEGLREITEETDVWGNPYVYKIRGDGFELFSPGPDGVNGTADDLY